MTCLTLEFARRKSFSPVFCKLSGSSETLLCVLVAGSGESLLDEGEGALLRLDFVDFSLGGLVPPELLDKFSILSLLLLFLHRKKLTFDILAVFKSQVFV